jgi:hypothetical protein
VSIKHGGRTVHAFVLSFADYPTGNVCLRYSPTSLRWSLEPQPGGARVCTCEATGNGT